MPDVLARIRDSVFSYSVEPSPFGSQEHGKLACTCLQPAPGQFVTFAAIPLIGSKPEGPTWPEPGTPKWAKHGHHDFSVASIGEAMGLTEAEEATGRSSSSSGTSSQRCRAESNPKHRKELLSTTTTPRLPKGRIRLLGSLGPEAAASGCWVLS